MDPAKMKVVDLRSELGALGLDTKGNKPALVERLKKALEAKTGKVFADTSILDTTNEDVDDTGTPRRPAARATRRRSSYLAATPAKVVREDPPEPIEEDVKEETDTSEPEPKSPPRGVPAPPPPETPPAPEPAPAPVQKRDSITESKETVSKPADKEIYNIDDEMSPSPEVKEEIEETGAKETMEVDSQESQERTDKSEGSADQDGAEKSKDEDGETDKEEKKETNDDERREKRPLTEEEEWQELNERLRIREQERLEREKKQAEEDARRFEEMSKDPAKLQRLKRKQERKQRWSNYYKSIEITNEVLAPPLEDVPVIEEKKETLDQRLQEPDINENRITLSWYDSDLNQYLEAPELNSVVPLSEGAFAHAWAGARASHGVLGGRVCYEVRLGDTLTTTESTEKEVVSNGLRVGWSTVDSTLHLGDGEFSWGYESTGRAVNNSEFKDYGKPFVEKDVIGVYLDLESTPCKIFYTLNGTELGTAYEFEKSALDGKALFPHVLTKNMCYKVNMGYEKYNMLTKTKIVRQRIEVPIEQVLEEKRQRDEIIRKREEELERQREERRLKVKREREERKKKKREERRKQREEEEKEQAKKKAEEDNQDNDKDAEKAEGEGEKAGEGDGEKAGEDSDGQGEDSGDNDEVKENGDKSAEAPPEEGPKESEPMETDQGSAEQPAASEETTGAEAPSAEPAEPSVKQEPEGKPVEVTEEQYLKGLVLDKSITFVIRNLVEEELDGVEACLVPGYVLIAHAELEPGPVRPETLADCEVILMVGMPGAGKTHWAQRHAAAHPQRRYNLLSTAAVFHNMQVDCKPFRTHYEGRWDAMVSKGAKCVLKLLEIAKTRRRNYILDQTNVYPSAQRRKLREFEGRRRIAVVVVPDAEEYRRRVAERPAAGKEVPDGALLDMKANFTLPEKCAWIDEVVFPELGREEAEIAVEAFHKEAKAAGVSREREKRDRSASKDAPPAKRARSPDRRQHGRDDRRRDFGRDRVSHTVAGYTEVSWVC
ncbi:uncharacterized protein [Epargyreus clarus]|uniref:uncharacterized protein isoform X2 n=1 Tax=Epargyreus clarus TaxID=520877 RepID=UPI003C2CEE1E